jgi:hypothetical protein
MAISEADIKLLWGRAAGFCSRPGCQSDLTKLEDGGKNYNVGEMAHVIAHSPSGPRGGGSGGSDNYENLILLCPTCHRDIDKAPAGKFPEDMLLSWKKSHENKIREIGLEQRFSTPDELIQAVGALLSENFAIWKALGPKSSIAELNPGSNAHKLWELRRVDRIVPNNRRIVNIIRANQRLLSADQIKAFAEFVTHAESYEEHLFDRLDSYPLFPMSFSKAFGQ